METCGTSSYTGGGCMFPHCSAAGVCTTEYFQSLAFNITLSRTYRWQTENEADQSTFLEALVRLFRILTPVAPLHLDGLSDPDDGLGS